MSIVLGAYYRGVPRTQFEALEAVLQGVVSQLHTLASGLKVREGEDSVLKANGDIRLLRDMSAGWWAIMEWEHPYADSPVRENRSLMRFRVFAKRGDVPVKIAKGFEAGKVPWEALEKEFLHGRCDMYFDMRRTSRARGWSGSLHRIDLQHPLLFVLLNAWKREAKEAEASTL